MIKLLRSAALAIALPFIAVSASAQLPPPPPDLYVVMFRADWCAPCKIVEPNLNLALRQLNDPAIRYINIDISDPVRSEASAHAAFDAQIVPHYNQWLGITGFAAIIDADTKTTMGCVNLTYGPADMVAHISSLKSIARTNAPHQDLTCPAPNRSL